MCTNCTGFGHNTDDCTNTKHPQAEQLVKEHIKLKREERIKREQRSQAQRRNSSANSVHAAALLSDALGPYEDDDEDVFGGLAITSIFKI